VSDLGFYLSDIDEHFKQGFYKNDHIKIEFNVGNDFYCLTVDF